MKFYDNIKKEHLFIFLIILTALILFSYFDFGYTGLSVKNTDTCTDQGYSCCTQGNGEGDYYFSLDDTCSVGKECRSSCQASYDRKSLVSGYSVFTDAFDSVKNFFTKIFKPSVAGITEQCTGTPAVGCNYYDTGNSCRYPTPASCYWDSRIGCRGTLLDCEQQSVSVCTSIPGCTLSGSNPPEIIQIFSPIEGEDYTTQTIDASGNAFDPDGCADEISSVRVRLNQGSWQDAILTNYCSFGVMRWNKYGLNLLSGPNIFEVQAFDFDGNPSEIVTVNFNYVPSSNYLLSVTKLGTGQGTVTSSPPGINCGTTCSFSYNSGNSVTLTAAASSGSTFAGWGGACAGTSTCVVSMTQAQSVTATFTLIGGGTGPEVTISHSPNSPLITQQVTFTSTPTFSSSAGGQVYIYVDTPNPTTANAQRVCTIASVTGTCSYTGGPYTTGQHTYLAKAYDYSSALWGESSLNTFNVLQTISCTPNTCNPNNNQQICNPQGTGYVSCLQGQICSNNQCVTQDTTPPTVFVVPSPLVPTTLQQVTITSTALDTSGISQVQIYVDNVLARTCTSSPCSTTPQTYTQGTHTYYSTARDNNGNTGRYPSGAGIRSMVVIPGSTTGTFLLTVNKLGTGQGTVTSTSNPTQTNQINCGTTCSTSYNSGTSVTLTAVASSGSTFISWSGACTSVSGTICTVTMSQAQSVTATFNTLTGDTTPPTVFVIHSPLAPTTLQQITITSTALDTSGISQIQIYVDNVLRRTCTSSPCLTTPQIYTQGIHSYYSTARDNNGNTGRSPSANGTRSFVVIPGNTTNEICNNNIDDDNDKAIDELDIDCTSGAYVNLDAISPTYFGSSSPARQPWEDSQIDLRCRISQTGSSLARAKDCIVSKVALAGCQLKDTNSDQNIDFVCDVGELGAKNVSCNILNSCWAGPLSSPVRHLNYTINVTKPVLCKNIVGEDRIDLSDVELDANSYDIGDIIESRITVTNEQSTDATITVSAQLYDLNERRLVKSVNLTKTIDSNFESEEYVLEIVIPSVEESRFKMYYKIYEQNRENRICLEAKQDLEIDGSSSSCDDFDDDGYEDDSCGGDDCNDDDDLINPGASEICTDSIDNDCNNLVDEQDSVCGGGTLCTSGDTRNCGRGICAGTQLCTSGSWDECIGGQQATTELCSNNLDDDCDGLTDINDADCGSADSDSDGLPDSWEQQYFGTLSYNGEDDVDNDGFSNLEEYAASTDPSNKDDRPEKPSLLSTILIVVGVIIVALALVWYFALRPKKPKFNYTPKIEQIGIKRPLFNIKQKGVSLVLKEYIQNSLRKGYSKEQIKKALLAKGWKNDEIEDGFKK